MRTRIALVTGAILAIVVFTTFAPLIGGDFLFDDFANLTALGKYGPVDDWDALLRYLTSGIADPLGRPLSLASFLLDANTWPAEPEAFLRTNVLLHATNSVIVAFVIFRLSQRLRPQWHDSLKIALLGAAIWGLHPLWVSTVGYVVQRQAMLSATFVLLGILAWIRSTGYFEAREYGAAWRWAFASIFILGALAILSKANGALLPLLLIVLNWTVLKRSPDGGRTHLNPQHRVAQLLLLALPALAVAIGILASSDAYPPGRPWSTSERLMSQPRAILDYLALLFIPVLEGPGVFADAFEASKSPWTPWTTLPAAATVVAMVAFAWRGTNRHPRLSAAILFFFAAHAMESTIVPLELYFEHRNYLPAALFGWPIAHWLITSKGMRLAKGALAASIVILLVPLTLARSSTWADQDVQAMRWSQLQPQSTRAQTWYAQRLLAAGNAPEARIVLTHAIAQQGDEIMLLLNLANTSCHSGRFEPELQSRILKSIAEQSSNKDITYSWIRRHALIDRNSCPELTPEFLRAAIDALRAGSPEGPPTTSRTRRLEAYVALNLHDCDAARADLAAAQRAKPDPAERYADIAALATFCGDAAALNLLTATERLDWSAVQRRSPMPRIHSRIVEHQGYWEAEIARLRETLLESQRRFSKESKSHD